ncbi:hypothetical protein TDB9533_02609 [Thalassocella blandensis]|nr:hypothetical protein TDB9533_02609 [Thalassocella blandensis]
MPLFDKDTFSVITEEGEIDLSKASMNKNLSVVDFDTQSNQFYISMDKVLFTNPVATIEKILDAHGFVTNLENILSCFDSCLFSIHAKGVEKSSDEKTTLKVNDYIPCMSFELPQKHKVGRLLQSFYEEIAKYDTGESGTADLTQVLSKDAKISSLTREVENLRAQNAVLNNKLNALAEELIAEKKQHKSTQGQDSQDALPGNTKICRVEHVDLKKRLVKVKALRKVIDIPTHMLDRVPEFKSRCLVTFDEENNIPLGVLFFDNKEMSTVERRVADLLVVEGDMFKARDSLRNEFQIQAVNPMEQNSIKDLKRGMKVLISIADDYVVRFSVLGSTNPNQFNQAVQEQLAVYDIGRNQLIMTDELDPSDNNS